MITQRKIKSRRGIEEEGERARERVEGREGESGELRWEKERGGVRLKVQHYPTLKRVHRTLKTLY